jgi:hypothetical protein
VPLPPARLLTLIGTGDHLFSSMMPVIIRIMLSVPPPGANGTTTSIVFDGYLACAMAAPGAPTSSASAAAGAIRERSNFMASTVWRSVRRTQASTTSGSLLESL